MKDTKKLTLQEFTDAVDSLANSYSDAGIWHQKTADDWVDSMIDDFICDPIEAIEKLKIFENQFETQGYIDEAIYESQKNY